ncbi:LysR family transcriptional regulator [Pseudomonas kitaguniensis]|uniref:LysR family transcriptional regulator n=1 Tax=Pseudomonas kitaguniensis TaxID=2607908 RepID=UPI003D0726A8
MDLLSGMEAFVQVAETKTFVAAARNLGLSPSAVSKLVGRTEEQVGARLFHRSTRSISLTAEGAIFLERCRSILEEVALARQELAIASSSPKGKLRVSLPNVTSLFLPVLSGFMDAYPHVDVEMDFTDKLVDVIEEGFDVVVRTGQLTDSRLTSRLLTTYMMRLVATPEYFAQRGLPQDPGDLEMHNCIQYRFPSTGRTEVWPIDLKHGLELRLNSPIVCNSTEARLELALQGRGIACLPDFLVQQCIDSGALVSVLDGHISWTGTFQLLWPASRHRAPKVRAFVDYFAMQFA